MDDVTREIRQMLLGNLETRGKYLAVSANKFTGVRYGMTDGADRILLLGVMRHTKYFTSELNNHKIKDAAHKSMMDIGRKVILDSNPNAEVVICRYMITKPIVLLFEIDDIGIKVETYTARGIGGLLSEAWIRLKFMHGMPDNLSKMSKEQYLARKKVADAKKAEEEKRLREERKAEREERKAEREERKAEREERKAEREEQEKEEKRQKAAEKEREKALKKRNKKLKYDADTQESQGSAIPRSLRGGEPEPEQPFIEDDEAEYLEDEYVESPSEIAYNNSEDDDYREEDYGENVDAIIDGLMDDESDGGGFEPDEENYDPDKVPAGGDVYGDDFDD